MSQPRTRQELYDLIKESGKQEVILEEMKRLGIWEDNQEKPSLAELLLTRQSELRKEISGLVAKQRKVADPEKLLQQYRKKRLEESRVKQKENREKRAQEKVEKAAAWNQRKSKEILYLGDDISVGLADKKSNPAQLQKFQLPDFADAAALATAMQTEVGQLRFLAYNRRVTKVSHYQRFYMQKNQAVNG